MATYNRIVIHTFSEGALYALSVIIPLTSILRYGQRFHCAYCRYHHHRVLFSQWLGFSSTVSKSKLVLFIA